MTFLRFTAIFKLNCLLNLASHDVTRYVMFILK